MGSGVLSRAEAGKAAADARARGERIVFTNGCFDILHVGHLRLLAAARAEGDRLFVAVNDDASVRRLKGEGRPLNPIAERLELLAALRVVDVAFPFSEDTPAAVIEEVAPDVLVKGADYELSEIVGADRVTARGGRVVRVPIVPGRSTSRLAGESRGGRGSADS